MLSVIVIISEMINICNCCKGCSSARQLSYSRHSFPKKLLVAISVIVLIAMIITPTEARPERRKPKQTENMAQTKDTIRTSQQHRRRHQKRLENLTLPTKETRRPKNAQAEMYITESRKILRKVKNTRSFFKEDQQQLTELKELKKYVRETTPSWVPTVNFVEIRFHDYSSHRSRKNGTTIPERKFKYIVPRLYKSLVQYEQLFNTFLKVELNFPDSPEISYKNKRKELLQKSLLKLYSTIQEVNDSMTAVNMTVPPLKYKLDLSKLEMKVDATQCLRNDYLAFRGYGNLLNNWYLEFRCPQKGRQASKRICREFEEKLLKKKHSRGERNHGSSTHRNRVTT